MGGHGGLNILPQKRWNVYGQRNRLKVHEDEAKHAETERARKEKRDRNEQEFRSQILRKRSKPGTDDKFEHINLFEEEERLQQHSDVKKEKEMEERKRGRKSDRTSDARFDAQFAFAHGLNESKPWYARPTPLFVEKVSKQDESRKQEEPISVALDDRHKSKKHKKKQKAKDLLKELKKNNFTKSEIDIALLRMERMKREKKERTREQRLLR